MQKGISQKKRPQSRGDSNRILITEIKFWDKLKGL